MVAGDVFGTTSSTRVVSQSLEAMRAIGVPVYLLPGSHDPLDAASVYTSALFRARMPANVAVLDRAGVHSAARACTDRRRAVAGQSNPPPIWPRR